MDHGTEKLVESETLHLYLSRMNPLTVLGLFTLVQAGFYWLCIRRRWNYVDFGMLAFAVFCNCWLLPKLLMEPSPDDGCAYSYNGMTQGLFFLGGNGISVFLFAGYAILRRSLEKKGQVED